MVRGSEHEWLLGDPSWWPNSDRGLLITRIGDLNPPKSWLITDPENGGEGWIRQRLQPVASRILYTTAWSFFFIISSTIPLIFPNKVFIDDQALAIILFSISWLMLLIPYFWFSNSNQEGINIFPLEFLGFTMGIVFFILHIIIDPILGWIAYSLFLLSWFRTVRNISDSVSVNSSRWLLPISESDFTAGSLDSRWNILTNKFRNGIIAKSSKIFGNYTAELTGVSYKKFRFIAFSVVYKNRIIHDPFNKNFVLSAQFDDFLSQPPINLPGDKWPEIFIRDSEEE